MLTVIASTILDDDCRRIENQRRERGIESALSQVGCALGRIPRVTHPATLQPYIHTVKRPNDLLLRRGRRGAPTLRALAVPLGAAPGAGACSSRLGRVAGGKQPASMDHLLPGHVLPRDELLKSAVEDAVSVAPGTDTPGRDLGITEQAREHIAELA